VWGTDGMWGGGELRVVWQLGGFWWRRLIKGIRAVYATSWRFAAVGVFVPATV